jgi:hypothetical protein
MMTATSHGNTHNHNHATPAGNGGQPAKVDNGLRRDELLDRLILVILVLTFLFALSYLYT